MGRGTGTVATPLSAATFILALAEINLEGIDAFRVGGDDDGRDPVTTTVSFMNALAVLEAPGTDSDAGLFTGTVTNPGGNALLVDMFFYVNSYIDVFVEDLDPGLYDLSATARVGYRLGDGPDRAIFDDAVMTRLDCLSGTCSFVGGAGDVIDGYSIAFTMDPDSTQDLTLFTSSSIALTRVAPPAAVPLPAGLGLALTGPGLLGWLRARR